MNDIKTTIDIFSDTNFLSEKKKIHPLLLATPGEVKCAKLQFYFVSKTQSHGADDTHIERDEAH